LTSRRRGWLVSSAVLIGVVTVGVLIRAGSTGDVARSPLPPVDFEAGVVHVHGLGVDPGDGTLFAATHSGLFRIPEEGPAVRVANREQDTMGFAITGPRQFIASGHPDRREDDVRPPLLGLIESGDAGESWERLSLHGAADFHALQAAHGKVYGYDSTSGTFMVSADRRTWDRRARLVIGSFAVSPTDPEVLLATTQRGLTRSQDGGRTFDAEPSEPRAALLAWPAALSLYVVDVDGTVRHSGDGGRTWARRGAVGATPEAMTVSVRSGGEQVYIATVEGEILLSTDGGKTFATRYKETRPSG